MVLASCYHSPWILAIFYTFTFLFQVCEGPWANQSLQPKTVGYTLSSFPVHRWAAYFSFNQIP